MGAADTAFPSDAPPPGYPAVVDLSNCDREPIHIPGSIQPHGVLFALSGPGLRVSAISANAAGLLGQEPRALLGVPLAGLTSPDSLAAIAAVARTTDDTGSRFVRIHLHGAAHNPWRALVHGTAGGMLLEVKLPQPEPELSSVDLFDRFDGATRRLQSAKDVAAICSCLAAEVRRLTGYDRVKVYRFARDWSGEVVAEDNRGNLPSYLGLHFPASDIPAQARDLYVRSPDRQIPDIDYNPVPLVQADPAPIDLSQAALRSVSPMHIQYLRHMAVGATMSVSILRGGTLWGLVACHHATPHYVPPELRQACVLLAQLAAWQLGVAEEIEITRRSVGVKAVEAALLQETTAGHDYREALLRHANPMLDLLDATGLALHSNNTLTTVGATPDLAELPGLLAWLAQQDGPAFETDRLPAQYPPAAAWTMAAGVLAVSLGGVAENRMVWFRPEIAKTVTWSGNPAKPVEHADGLDRLTPRRSFEAWTQEVRGQSRPWAPHEIAAANGLRDLIVDIVLRRSQELEQLNRQLARSNEELESFAYIASHDLTEPLRQIETFGSLIELAVRRQAPPDDEVTHWFDGIQTSARRLRTLIRDLARYSRLGSHANPLQPTDLGALVQAVQGELAGVIAATGASIVCGPSPQAMCDPVQMQQVFQNLLSNALKYRHPDRPPVVTIASTVRPAVDSPRNAHPVLDIAVADNGIGFDERHRERIFEPFYRLHSTDEYEGSGIGLAICRKIMGRHGGTITARSQRGQGAVFTISLPLRPLPEQDDDTK